jgi:AcrR family transcriptional regulator
VSSDALAEPPERWARTVAQRASRAHGRRTLARLLDSGLAELTTHGYHGARMARIAKRAGTAHGTVYVYFSSKDDLLGAIHAEVDAELQPAMLALPALERGRPGYDQIRAWMVGVCDVFQRHGAVMQAVAEALSDEEDSSAGKAALRSLGRCTSHIAERIRATGAPGLDPAVAALCIFALIEGANRSVFRGELLVDRDDLVTGLAEFVHRSIFGVETQQA